MINLYLIAVIGLAIALVVAFLKGKSAERNRRNKLKIEEYEKARKIEESVRTLTNSELSALLRRKYPRI